MALAANYGGGGAKRNATPRMTYAGPGSDSANPNAVSFAQHRLQNAEAAGVIPHQHLPTDALGLVSLYHALSPQIAHAVNTGSTLQAPYPHPLPAPQARPHPMAAPVMGGGPAPMAAPAPHPQTLPQHVSAGGPLDALLAALGRAPRGMVGPEF